MKLHQLDIRNLRGYGGASFEFDDRFTLLVGINGVGKTTILEALRVCLSHMLPKFANSKSKKEYFTNEDIKVGSNLLNIKLEFSIGEDEGNLSMSKKREKRNRNISDDEDLTSNDDPKFHFHTSTEDHVIEKMSRSHLQPIGVYFSTNRSVPREIRRRYRKNTDKSIAHVDSLSGQLSNLEDLAEWTSRQDLETRNLFPMFPGLRIEALRKAVEHFLPDCKNLDVTTGGTMALTVEKFGDTLNINQLSHGERSVLAFVLDLARRLTLSNPEMDDPVSDGMGVVLIDELELHIHPQWQRCIIDRLCETFPKCQFVATTHSPLFIGEVYDNQVKLIEDGIVYEPSGSYGADSNRILEEVMYTQPRKHIVQEKLNRIFELIVKKENKKAMSEIKKLENEIGQSEPDLVRARTRLNLRNIDS